MEKDALPVGLRFLLMPETEGYGRAIRSSLLVGKALMQQIADADGDKPYWDGLTKRVFKHDIDPFEDGRLLERLSSHTREAQAAVFGVCISVAGAVRAIFAAFETEPAATIFRNAGATLDGLHDGEISSVISMADRAVGDGLQPDISAENLLRVWARMTDALDHIAGHVERSSNPLEPGGNAV